MPRALLKAAIRDPNPVIFLENEIVYGHSFPVPKLDDYVLPIGKARVIKQGADVTIVSHSICVGLILEAAEALAKEGIDAELIDLRTLRPLDTDTVIESVKKTNRLVTVEQGWPICSIGSEIAAQVVEKAFDWLDAPPTKVTGKDVPMPYAANLEKLALPHCRRRGRGGESGLLPGLTMGAAAGMTWKKGGCHCGAVRLRGAGARRGRSWSTATVRCAPRPAICI